MRRVILASASPRRKELLRLVGLRFTVRTGIYEEDLSLKLGPHALARHLSREKARAAIRPGDDALIIAADTFIVHGRKILGKPLSASEAVRMLAMLSGRAHTVITGYTVLDTETGTTVTRSVATRVWFRRLSPAAIRAYVKTGEPLDKAGAYAIQGIGSQLVKKIEGDYFNVIGLPVSSLAETLETFGITLLG